MVLSFALFTKGSAPTQPPVATRAAAVPTAERYVLLERLGEGGMGVVWRARDRLLDRHVAFKVLHDEFLGAADQQRLATEARAMAKLSHPNVVAVYDVGEREGRTYLTMELVAGVPLSRWFAAPRHWREVVAVFRHAGEGLAAAHAAELVHRDIKPDNILVGDDGRVLITDFGIAHAHASAPIDAGTATNPIGSPAYMSPERLRGEPADARGDQFGFCVALYEALHGTRPYDEPTLDGLVTVMEAGAPPPIRDVPRWLHAVLVRGLAPDPAARFPSMRALLDALRDPRRRIIVVGASVLGAAGLVLGGALVFGGADTSPCESAAHHLAGVWDAPTKQRLAAAFTASKIGFAPATWAVVERNLDAHATQWIAMHEAACRATRVDHTQSAEVLDRRMLCLDRRRAGLLQAVSVLGAADPIVIEKAPEIARGLAPIAECADPSYLAALGGGNGDAGARGDLPAARIALFTGELRPGHERVQRVIASARSAGDRSLEAEALIVRGELEALLRQDGASAETLGHAIELAGEIGAIRTRIDGWIGLSATLQSLGRLPEAGPLLDLADAALREAPDARRQGLSANARGTLFARQSQYDRAVLEFERSLALQSQVYGPSSPSLAAPLKNLAQAQRRLGRNDDAARTFSNALTLVEPLGLDHPETLRVRRGRAVLYDTMGRSEDALAEFREILRARRERFGDEHLDVASSHDDLAISLGKLGRTEASLAAHRAGLAIRQRLAPGSREVLDSQAHVAETLLALGQHAEAETMLHEVLAGRTTLFGRKHIDVAVAHHQLGHVLAEGGSFDAAAAALHEARAIFTELYGKDHRDVAKTYREEAIIERKRGRSARAAELAQRAVTAFGDARDLEAGLARWELAQALGNRHARARSLAKEARELAAAAQGTIAASVVAAIDAWLGPR